MQYPGKGTASTDFWLYRYLIGAVPLRDLLLQYAKTIVKHVGVARRRHRSGFHKLRSLNLRRCLPYPEQESEEIEYGIVARLNPFTGALENLEILFFSKRLFDQKLFELPVIADLRLARASTH